MTKASFWALGRVAAADGASRDTVLSRLADLTAKCVACHANYRLEAPD